MPQFPNLCANDLETICEWRQAKPRFCATTHLCRTCRIIYRFVLRREPLGIKQLPAMVVFRIARARTAAPCMTREVGNLTGRRRRQNPSQVRSCIIYHPGGPSYQLGCICLLNLGPGPIGQPLSRPLARRRRVAIGQPLPGLLFGHTRATEGDGCLRLPEVLASVIGLIPENVNRTEWQIGPWQRSIQWAGAI
jgi:hypothetical protein